MRYVYWKPSKAKFTGISSTAQESMGLVNFPIGLIGFKSATYSSDVLGQLSSTCPGLVPLRTLMRMGCVLVCNYYRNGDGLLGIRNAHDSTGYSPQRLFLTDSGHYLLPIDKFHNTGRDIATGSELKAITGKLHASVKNHSMAEDTQTAVDLVVGCAEEDDTLQTSMTASSSTALFG